MTFAEQRQSFDTMNFIITNIQFRPIEYLHGLHPKCTSHQTHHLKTKSSRNGLPPMSGRTLVLSHFVESGQISSSCPRHQLCREGEALTASKRINHLLSFLKWINGGKSWVKTEYARCILWGSGQQINWHRIYGEWLKDTESHCWAGHRADRPNPAHHPDFARSLANLNRDVASYCEQGGSNVGIRERMGRLCRSRGTTKNDFRFGKKIRGVSCWKRRASKSGEWSSTSKWTRIWEVRREQGLSCERQVCLWVETSVRINLGRISNGVTFSESYRIQICETQVLRSQTFFFWFLAQVFLVPLAYAVSCPATGPNLLIMFK